MIHKAKIWVLHSGKKWSNIIYPSSSVKSRMPTKHLMADFKNGKIIVLNPGKLVVD